MQEMPPDNDRKPAPVPSPGPSSVSVKFGARGAWEIGLSNHPDRVTCETLEDAQRVAYLYASQGSPCELVVHDAYHRVRNRRLINGASDLRPADSPT